MCTFYPIIIREHLFSMGYIKAGSNSSFERGKDPVPRCCTVQTYVKDGSLLVGIQCLYRKKHPGKVCCRECGCRSIVSIVRQFGGTGTHQSSVTIHLCQYHLDDDLPVGLPHDHPWAVRDHQFGPFVIIGLPFLASPERNEVTRSRCHVTSSSLK